MNMPPNVAGRLAQIFVPEGHQRYASLVEWSATADLKWWKFGKSSDGRKGIWISYDKWDGGHSNKKWGAAQ